LLIKSADIIEERMRRIGQIVRMGKDTTVKVTKEWTPIAVRRIGRQRLRCGDGDRGVVGKVKI
jgi:hypothetical protein